MDESANLYGGPGDDFLKGGDYDDVLTEATGTTSYTRTPGGPGEDELYGGEGDDTLDATDGDA